MYLWINNEIGDQKSQYQIINKLDQERSVGSAPKTVV